MTGHCYVREVRGSCDGEGGSSCSSVVRSSPSDKRIVRRLWEEEHHMRLCQYVGYDVWGQRLGVGYGLGGAMGGGRSWGERSRGRRTAALGNHG